MEATAPLTHRDELAINVRRARLSDYPKIADFIREAYEESAPYKEKERWDWQFANNPYAGSEDDSVPVWIAETSGKVVGQIAVQEGNLQIDGVPHAAGWIVDVMILPAYRGLRLGHRLYSAVAQDRPILVTLTMAEATRRMAERVGAIDLGEAKLFSRFVHLDSRTVERYLRARTVYRPRIHAAARILCERFFLHHILTAFGNLLLSFRNHLFAMPRIRKNTAIVECDHFGPDIDLFWQRVAHEFPVAFTRDSKWLNWRFCECPQMRYHLFTASRDGNIVGYMILRRTEAAELPQGVIVDLVAARQDRDTIEDLVAFATKFFGNNIASVECATTIPEFADVLRPFGFHPVRTERPNCVVADPELRERLAISANEWLLSKADHDWDQVHVA